MTAMRTHADIIRPAEVEALASALGVSVHTVRSWRQRDSIPAEHWKVLVGLGAATLDELADAAAAKRATDANQQGKAA